MAVARELGKFHPRKQTSWWRRTSGVPVGAPRVHALADEAALIAPAGERPEKSDYIPPTAHAACSGGGLTGAAGSESRMAFEPAPSLIDTAFAQQAPITDVDIPMFHDERGGAPYELPAPLDGAVVGSAVLGNPAGASSADAVPIVVMLDD